MLSKAGQKANLSDHGADAIATEICNKALDATKSESESISSQTSSSSPDYVPQVGDIVSLVYKYSGGKVPCEGLIFTRGNDLRIWHNGEGRVCQGNALDSHKTRFKKIGVSDIASHTGHDDTEKIARAYFAKPKSFTPDPDKSYAENQAAWVKFHGLKVGDKVKVVRKFEDSEDGGIYGPWNYTKRKAQMQGKVYKISVIESHFVNISEQVASFPYFALEPVK